ncbi:phytanoyl-CoA dioxygenase family protein [Oculatella sp. LEGE 06141]|uniref:phytanoyl-CoA dioxygenase family protein n=1 Tax=Oculatella sp. LEGE 06141 TaxID=1828648 RepID=UPI00187F1539|nr:phytanoyl-CoA dioxygenase family protein [Oculatella sp. LEGE 06141]MBE9179496.1 phytanoyl-CoA dioxygenase family protein [Oculatella sp. LEGE 06141]
MLTKFNPTELQDIQNYYEQNGYVIVSKLLQESAIDNFLKEYNRFKARPFYVFRSQDTNQPELIRSNEQGFLEHSILDPQNLVFAKGFTSTVEKCITSTAISNLLKQLSGKDKHIIWQSMFFDKSTGTVAHQDHYYLDTDPAGHLIAAWFALEDIHPDAGCFFVVPGSHRGEVLERTASGFKDHEDFVSRTQQLISENNYQFKPCPLAKGDVLFWHPFTVHGAFTNINPQYSRKSFTAHFVPEGMNWRRQASLPEKVASSNPNVYFWKRDRLMDHLRFFKNYADFTIAQATKRKPKMEMRGIEYEQKS